jgi:putative RNA 2'-phosphotransferase
MNPDRVKRISKFLAKSLRHEPEAIGLALEPGGWVPVEALLRACAKQGLVFTRAQLDEVVATNDKQRFGFDPTGQKIRANQGHSVAVDLQLCPIKPPPCLYHGTGAQSVKSILAHGLEKRSRHHVHLSDNTATARAVGTRHGKPIVLTVLADTMDQAGFVFYRSENGVWLTDHVPPEYLRLP